MRFSFISNGLVWQDFVSRLFVADRDRPGSPVVGFKTISAERLRDYGLDGIEANSTGTIFQMYLPMYESGEARHERVNKKLDDTVRKIKENEQEIEQIIGSPVHRLILVISENPDVKIRKHEQQIDKAVPYQLEIWGESEVSAMLSRHYDVVRDLLPFSEGIGHSSGSDQQVDPKRSTELEQKRKEARTASHKHQDAIAMQLWDEVCQQAQNEGNKADEISARMQIALLLLRSENNPDEALRIADECLRDAKSVDLGEDRCQMLQLTGEIHRAKGNLDQARGFITSALEHSRQRGAKRDEGLALLAMSALEMERDADQNRPKALELIRLAYDCFMAHYASGDIEAGEQGKEGCAISHISRARIYERDRPDDALAEYTRALELFKDLGPSFR